MGPSMSKEPSSYSILSYGDSIKQTFRITKGIQAPTLYLYFINKVEVKI